MVVDINYEDVSLYDIEFELINYKLIIIRGAPEVRQYIELISNVLSPDFKIQFSELLLKQNPPSPEALLKIVNNILELRKRKLLSHIFAPLVKRIFKTAPIYIDCGTTRFYFPNNYFQYRKYKSFNPQHFLSYIPYDEPDAPIVESLPIGPHRDIDIFTKAMPINIWFPLHSLNNSKSLIFYPKANFKELASFPDISVINDMDKFGESISFNYNVGDIVLFNPEIFHSTPPNNIPRVSSEVRLSVGCYDDHAIYRKSFLDLNIFSKSNEKKSIYDDLEDCFNISSGYEFILCPYVSPLAYKEIKIQNFDFSFNKILSRVDLPPSVKIFIFKLMHVRNINRSISSELESMLDDNITYYWAFEVARFCILYGHIEYAEKFLFLVINKTHETLANVYYRNTTPTRRENFTLQPKEALEISSVIISDIREEKIKNTEKIFRNDMYCDFSNIDIYIYRTRGQIHLHNINYHNFTIYSINSFRLFICYDRSKYENLDDVFNALKQYNFDSIYIAYSEQGIMNRIINSNLTIMKKINNTIPFFPMIVDSTVGYNIYKFLLIYWVSDKSNDIMFKSFFYKFFLNFSKSRNFALNSQKYNIKLNNKNTAPYTTPFNSY